MKQRHFPYLERLVPLDMIAETGPQSIELRCSSEGLEKMEPFVQAQFTRVERPRYLVVGSAFAWPYVVPESEAVFVSQKEEHIPPGELAFRRGAAIEASDGPIGRVDEFLVNPADCHVTHLVMREGHLWGQKDVTIPVGQIGRFEGGVVYLKLSKRDVAGLPTIPIRREAS